MAHFSYISQVAELYNQVVQPAMSVCFVLMMIQRPTHVILKERPHYCCSNSFSK